MRKLILSLAFIFLAIIGIITLAGVALVGAGLFCVLLMVVCVLEIAGRLNKAFTLPGRAL